MYKKKILIVDDEESIRFTFGRFLANEGYDVITAVDYQEAVSCIDQTEFDLILADFILGGKTGIDIMSMIKERSPSCPVIIMTGATSDEIAKKAIRMGAFAFVVKPIHKEKLLKVTQKALNADF